MSEPAQFPQPDRAPLAEGTANVPGTASVPPPWPPRQPYAVARPRHELPTWAVVLIVLAVVGACGSIARAVTGSAENPPAGSLPAVPTQPLVAPTGGSTRAEGHTVTFEVTTADGNVDMVNWSTLENSAVLNDEVSPFTTTVPMRAVYGLVGVTASDGSRLTCRLTVDGVIVATVTGDGDVNCSAPVGPGEPASAPDGPLDLPRTVPPARSSGHPFF